MPRGDRYLPRPILYWNYTITSIDTGGDMYTDRQPFFESREEATREAEAHEAHLRECGHTSTGFTVFPVYGAER